MSTASVVRRQIFYFVDEKPFAIRDFFQYGPRTAVYQEFYRLVKMGILTRLTYGLFIKATAAAPSIEEIAKAKAAAFKKTIAMHGSKAAYALKIINQCPAEHIFAVNGASSSFRVGTITVRLVGQCARKMYFGDDAIGLALRALWWLGRKACDVSSYNKALIPFRRQHRQIWRRKRGLIPHWIQRFFDCFGGVYIYTGNWARE